MPFKLPDRPSFGPSVGVRQPVTPKLNAAFAKVGELYQSVRANGEPRTPRMFENEPTSPLAQRPPQYHRSSSADTPPLHKMASQSHTDSYMSPQTRSPTMHSSPSSTPKSRRRDSVHLPTLSLTRQVELVDFIDAAVRETYAVCRDRGHIQWQHSRTKEGVIISRPRNAEKDTALATSVRAKCTVSASFDELMDAMITSSTEAFVGHESVVNPEDFLDGQVLAVLQPRTMADRFVCIKWQGLRSPAPTVAKHRDFVYVELVDQFEDREGNRIGFRLSKSVDLNELSNLDPAQFFFRGKMLSLYAFTEVGSGSLDLYSMVLSDLGPTSELPSWLLNKLVDMTAMRVARLRNHITQNRFDSLVFANPKDMVPLNKRVCCILCTKSFSIMRKKYNCVACGDVVCHHCSVHVVLPDSVTAVMGKSKARVCVKCSGNLSTAGMNGSRSSASSSHSQSERGMRGSTPQASNWDFLRRKHSLRRSDPSESSRSSTSRSSDMTRRTRDGSSLTASDGSTTPRDGSTPSGRSSSSRFRTRSSADSAARRHQAQNRPPEVKRKKSLIPQMFHFQGGSTPSPPSQEMEAERSSTSRPSSSYSDDAHTARHSRSEIKHLLDTGLSTSGSSSKELDLGVGKYKTEYMDHPKSSFSGDPNGVTKQKEPEQVVVKQVERSDAAIEQVELLPTIVKKPQQPPPAPPQTDEPVKDNFLSFNALETVLGSSRKFSEDLEVEELKPSASFIEEFDVDDDEDDEMEFEIEEATPANGMMASVKAYQHQETFDVDDDDSDEGEYVLDETDGSGAVKQYQADFDVGDFTIEAMQPSDLSQLAQHTATTEDVDSDDDLGEFEIEEITPATLSRRKSSAVSLSSSEADSDDLEIEELAPASDADEVSFLSDAEPDVKFVQPMQVHKVAKLLLGSKKQNEEEAQDGRNSDTLSDDSDLSVEEHEPQTADFTSNSEEKERSSEVDAGESDEEKVWVDNIQISDLQVHLDRMTNISKSLRSLNTQSQRPSSTAMATLTAYEVRAEADAAATAAAKIAANFINAFGKSSGPKQALLSYSATAGMTLPPQPRYHLTLDNLGDEIKEYLQDSHFDEELEAEEEDMAPGWRIIRSYTIEKVYYYDLDCGQTSWTVPPADKFFVGVVYMLL